MNPFIFAIALLGVAVTAFTMGLMNEFSRSRKVRERLEAAEAEIENLKADRNRLSRVSRNRTNHL